MIKKLRKRKKGKKTKRIIYKDGEDVILNIDPALRDDSKIARMGIGDSTLSPNFQRNLFKKVSQSS